MVRDHDDGLLLHLPHDHAVQVSVGFRVEPGGRLVEDDDRRILEQCARNRELLLFAAGEARAVAADLRVFPLGHAADIARNAADAHRVLHALASGAAGQVDVVGDAAEKQVRLLADDREQPAVSLQRKRAHVLPVGQHRAGLRLVKAQEQVQDRRLAAAVLPDDRDLFARLHMEAHVAQDLPVFLVAETDVLEGEARRHAAQAGGAVVGLHLHVEEAEQPLG